MDFNWLPNQTKHVISIVGAQNTDSKNRAKFSKGWQMAASNSSTGRILAVPHWQQWLPEYQIRLSAASFMELGLRGGLGLEFNDVLYKH